MRKLGESESEFRDDTTVSSRINLGLSSDFSGKLQTCEAEEDSKYPKRAFVVAMRSVNASARGVFLKGIAFDSSVKASIFKHRDDFTRSRPFLITTQQKISLLGDEAGEAMKILKMKDYNQALMKMDSLSDSIRNIILSGELPEEMAKELDPLLDSLEKSKYILYSGIREKEVANTVKQQEIDVFLEGLGKTLKAFAQLELKKKEET